MMARVGLAKRKTRVRRTQRLWTRRDGVSQRGQNAKLASARTIKTISAFKSVSLSTIRPRGIKDEIRQLDGMARLWPVQATPSLLRALSCLDGAR
jgi:hypothetical protein